MTLLPYSDTVLTTLIYIEQFRKQYSCHTSISQQIYSNTAVTHPSLSRHTATQLSNVHLSADMQQRSCHTSISQQTCNNTAVIHHLSADMQQHSCHTTISQQPYSNTVVKRPSLSRHATTQLSHIHLSADM